MKRVQWSDLATVAEDVRSGNEIEVLDGERVVAKVVPFREQTIEERIDQLVAQGKARRGTGTLPDSFFRDPLLKFESGSVVEQLLEDRRSKDSIPEWFFNERPPKFPSSVLEQLLHDRRSRDW